MIVYEDWKDVDGTYDLFFLDSSAGINGWEGCREHHRHDCLCYAMPLLRNGAMVICHDMGHRINKQVERILQSKYFREIYIYRRMGFFKTVKKWWLERPSPTKE